MKENRTLRPWLHNLLRTYTTTDTPLNRWTFLAFIARFVITVFCWIAKPTACGELFPSLRLLSHVLILQMRSKGEICSLAVIARINISTAFAISP